MVFGVHHSNIIPLSAFKQFLVCSKKLCKGYFCHIGFFEINVNADKRLCKLLQDNFMRTKKTFVLGSQILFPD